MATIDQTFFWIFREVARWVFPYDWRYVQYHHELDRWRTAFMTGDVGGEEFKDVKRGLNEFWRL